MSVCAESANHVAPSVTDSVHLLFTSALANKSMLPLVGELYAVGE